MKTTITAKDGEDTILCPTCSEDMQQDIEFDRAGDSWPISEPYCENCEYNEKNREVSRGGGDRRSCDHWFVVLSSLFLK